MWPIEEILIDNMQSTKSAFEEFIASDYFNKLNDNSRQIIILELEVVKTNIDIFNEEMRRKGTIGEKDYGELLADAFKAKDYLIKYQKKVIDELNNKGDD